MGPVWEVSDRSEEDDDDHDDENRSKQQQQQQQQDFLDDHEPPTYGGGSKSLLVPQENMSDDGNDVDGEFLFADQPNMNGEGGGDQDHSSSPNEIV